MSTNEHSSATVCQCWPHGAWMALDQGGAPWWSRWDVVGLSGRVLAVGPAHTFADLARAIEGKGAYHWFRDLIGDQGLTQAWRDFCHERQIGRARAYLAELGIATTR